MITMIFFNQKQGGNMKKRTLFLTILIAFAFACFSGITTNSPPDNDELAYSQTENVNTADFVNYTTGGVADAYSYDVEMNTVESTYTGEVQSDNDAKVADDANALKVTTGTRSMKLGYNRLPLPFLCSLT